MEGKIIRKLSIGSDVNNQLHISVGSRMGGSVISNIIEVEPNNVYDIFVLGTDNTVFEWKTIARMPVIVEYDTRIS